MEDLETVYDCPLDKVCREIRDGKIHQCVWYQKLVGKDPNTGKDHDEWGCAISWLPILSVEMARTNQGQTAALESFRNEMVRGNEVTVQALLATAHTRDPKLIESDDG